jgi:hypothetical protein
MLAGCGEDAWDGSADAAACPALPADVVADVAGGLATADDAADAEKGALSPAQTATGDFYRCTWPTADGDGDGLRVSLRSSSRTDLPQTADLVESRRGTGVALAGGGVQGEGAAFADGDGGRAIWYCEFRVLDVQLRSPKEGTVAATGARRLAEALIPQTGCAAT